MNQKQLTGWQIKVRNLPCVRAAAEAYQARNGVDGQPKDPNKKRAPRRQPLIELGSNTSQQPQELLTTAISATSTLDLSNEIELLARDDWLKFLDDTPIPDPFVDRDPFFYDYDAHVATSKDLNVWMEGIHEFPGPDMSSKTTTPTSPTPISSADPPGSPESLFFPEDSNDDKENLINNGQHPSDREAPGDPLQTHLVNKPVRLHYGQFRSTIKGPPDGPRHWYRKQVEYVKYLEGALGVQFDDLWHGLDLDPAVGRKIWAPIANVPPARVQRIKLAASLDV